MKNFNDPLSHESMKLFVVFLILVVVLVVVVSDIFEVVGLMIPGIVVVYLDQYNFLLVIIVLACSCD